MQITVKLYAMLSEYLPPGAVRNVSRLEVVETTTVGMVIEQLGLPPEVVHLVMMNGVYVPPSQRSDTVLKDADSLAIWPPVAGG
ncbi:MAG: MoaD/ThiS family protein [Candidatus Competibacteraceae bacterium]